MKRLTLLRHAKSGDDGTVARDFDRPLNAKGRRAARAIGRHLRDQRVVFDRVVASPALRVAETIEEVATGRAAVIDPAWDQRIYMATARELLEIVRATPESVGSLLLVGHNPGLEELVLSLVPDRDEDDARDKVEQKYPTAGLAEITLPIAQWADTRAGAGQLVAFTRPRDLDPALGPDMP
jgi:phosphohistidine phosphatase